jgi:hypothetical protein
MVEAILDGRQPEGATLSGLLEGVPMWWNQQATLEAYRSPSKVS